MNRYKKGWFGESHRHYLASKGIKTKRYLVNRGLYERREYCAKKEEIDKMGEFRPLKETEEEKRRYGAFVDNPHGEWLKDEIGAGRKTVTAGTFHLPMKTDKLLKVRGENEEETRMDSERSRERVKELAESMKEYGFAENEGILVWVDRFGKPTIAEGNHRIRAAKLAGIEEVPVEVRWINGGEDDSGEWGYKKLVRELDE